MVTPQLFKKYPTPRQLSRALQGDVEKIIHSTGFFRNKAKNLIACAQGLLDDHEGEIPRTIEELSALPGVGRKTANVVLGNCFNINEGFVVDTHVKRITGLLGLTKYTDPEKIELDLMKLFPQEAWCETSHLLIFHGRRTCIARRPQCDLCVLAEICPARGKTPKGG